MRAYQLGLYTQTIPTQEPDVHNSIPIFCTALQSPMISWKAKNIIKAYNWAPHMKSPKYYDTICFICDKKYTKGTKTKEKLAQVVQLWEDQILRECVLLEGWPN